MRHTLLGTVALAAVLPLAAPTIEAGEDLKAAVRAFSEVTVDPSCLSIHDAMLGHANLQVALTGGVACPLMAGEMKIGWFYSGHATFRYTSRDRIEQPVLRSNAKTEGRVEIKDTDSGLTVITGTSDTVLFASSSPPLPALEGDATGPKEDAFEKHRVSLARYAGLSLPHLLAAATLDRWANAAVVVEMAGGDGPLRYTYEPTDARAESFEILGTYATEDREVRKELRSTVLSDQPIDRDRRDPVSPPFVVSDVDYQVTAPGGDAVTVIARMTVVPVRKGLQALRFRIPGRILDSGNVGDSSPRDYRIVAVTRGAGEPLAFDQRPGDVLVDLGHPAATGQAETVVFRIEGNYLIRPNGDNYWILDDDEVFPQPEFGGAQYTAHGVIRVKKPFIAFASGATVRRTEEGDVAVLEVRSDLTSPHHAVIAGKYAFSEDKREGVTVRVATYAAPNVRSQQQLTELAFGMIRYYERFLGPFPTPELNIVQVNDLGWGQAPLGMLLITNEAFDRMLPASVAHFYTEGINERFAHEIAHQWWGNAVHPANANETWISESFAEYCAGLMVKRAQGAGKYDNLKATWKLRAKESSRVAPVALANRISYRDASTYFEQRFGLLYGKGPLLLARLHDEIGDEKFQTFLKSYQKTLRGKYGSTKLVQDLLRVLTGKDYAPFFDANYWATGLPN